MNALFDKYFWILAVVFLIWFAWPYFAHHYF